ncbi:phage tail tape measure protein [Isoptericola sp. NPDC019482]|uniref:phage tail tape measure protein n=1 Tax=Isoptericola sp. NPDC019482 TaxID=3154688 RepID=UPI003494B8A2
MADRSIRIVMSASVQGLVNGFKTANTAAKNLNTQLKQNEQAAQQVTTSLGLVGAAGVAGAGLAIKTFATFDKQMSNVKATGAATAGELNKLREAAVQAGASTAFSATEAAAGIENLLKAGVAAKDVLGGGLAGSLDLAAAGELGVADAAEIAATAMTQFNLSGRDVTHVADLLAAGAGKAAGDVTQISQALNQAGLVASQTGLSIEETTGTLAAFASAGLLGSDAGTSFKTMLQRLSAPTKENAKYMAELGISAYDAQGNFVGMSALAGQLTDALGKMTPAQRNAALATIFGADAVRAASVVYDQGAKGIDSWIGKVNDQGYAAETAAARLDNLQGDLEALGGAFESAFIRAGAGGNDVLRGLTQGASHLVTALGELPTPILGTTTALVGGGGLVALGVAGLGKLALSVNEINSAWSSMGRNVKFASVGMAGALSAATVGIAVWAQNAAEARAAVEEWKATLDEFGNTTDTTLEKVNEGLAKSREVWWQVGEDQRSAIEIADQYGVAIEDVQAAILGSDDALTRVNKSLATANERYTYGTSGAYLFQQGSARLLETISQQSAEIRKSTTEKQREAAANEAAGIAQDGLTDATRDTTTALEDYAAAQEEAWQATRKAAGVVLDLRSAQASYEASLDEVTASLEKNGKTLDISTEAGRANDEALRKLAGDALDVADSMREGGAGANELSEHMRSARKDVIKAATSLGMSKAEAKAFADQLGLIPGNVNVKVYADTDDALRKIARVRKQVLNLPDKKITVTTDTQVTGGWGSRAGGLPWGDGEGAGWTGGVPRGVSAMSKAVRSIDPGARITSGYRPGAVTATGYPSYHGMGRAIDIVSPNMGRTWDLLRRAFGSQAKELFYTPRGFLRNGVMGGAAPVTRRTHYSHVHLALANGGRLPGPAPADPREDNLLGVDEHGMPLARVRSREWVVNQGASDYYGDALMSAINSRRIPREELAALQGLAGGGAVGSADSAVKRAERELSRARAARRAAKKEKTKAAAEKRVEQAEERLSKARERRSNLRESRTDLSLDVRRGGLISSATSGADGAYGVVDEMRSLALSGDLGKRRSRTLASQASKAEAAVRGLYKEVDKVDKRLESAADNTERLQTISDGVKNALMGEQSLSDLVQEGTFRDVTRTNSRGETWTEQMWDAGGTTAKGLVNAKQGQASRAMAFAEKLNKLRAKGLSGTILEEIGNLGSEKGMQVADALLKDPGQIDDLNKAYKDVAKYSGAAGEYVTDAFSKGGLSAAKSFEAGLVNQKSSLEKQAYNWGVYMANGISAALTGKKTGLKKRARGGQVAPGTPYLVGEEGPELIVPAASGHVMTAARTRHLADTAQAARRFHPAAASGPSVTVALNGDLIATDTNAAVDRMYTKAWDAINTHGINALAQGVGV